MVSCSEEEKIEDSFTKAGSVTLQLNSSLIATRATEAGVDAYNENLIGTVDCFFYPTGKTNESAVLTYTKTVDATGTATIIIPTDEIDKAFGATGEKAVVYVIANLPEAQREEWSKMTTTSIQNLKGIAITADFTKKQDSFVMDGEDVVTLVRDEMKVTGTVDLKRAASKISLFITEVLGTVKDSDGITWESDPTGMEVHFFNGVEDAIVDVTSVDPYSVGSTSYFNDTRVYNDTKGSEGYAQELPFYSYSSDWEDNTENMAYLTLVVPWKKDGESVFKSCYYSVPVNLSEKNFERNTYYKIKLAVSLLGSFVPEEPIELEPSYVILDWGTEELSANLQNFKYLVVDENYKEIFNVEKCEIGYSSSSPITIKVEKVTYPSYDTGTRVDNEYFPGTEYDNEDLKNILFENSLDDPSDDYVPYTFYLKVTNTDGMYDYITIVQYPSLYMSMGAGDDIFVNGYFARVKDAKLSGATKHTASGRTDRYYSHDHNRNGNNGSPTGNSGYVVASYGNVYSTISNENLAITGTTNVYVTAFNSTNNTYSDGSATPVTYRIGDPRVASNWNNNTNDNSSLDRYLTAQTSNSRTRSYWGDASEIQVSTTERNIIAPAYKISSAYAIINELTYEVAQKRCATYQEAGYPAGRWRLPTEAEIMFVRDHLQGNGKILNLFVPGNTAYWASSTRYISNDRFTARSNSSTTAYSRCVYDIWYWGDNPKDAHTYHATEDK